MKNVPAYSMFILLLFTIYNGAAQTWSSRQDGLWNDAATWTLNGVGDAYPPATLTAGMRVVILHDVAWSVAFLSSMNVNAGATLFINGGTFRVESGIAML